MTITMPPQAQRALAALESAGYEAYIVGGCVRDELMGRTPGDYDITTSALPEQVEQCFVQSFLRHRVTSQRNKKEHHSDLKSPYHRCVDCKEMTGPVKCCSGHFLCIFLYGKNRVVVKVKK